MFRQYRQRKRLAQVPQSVGRYSAYSGVGTDDMSIALLPNKPQGDVQVQQTSPVLAAVGSEGGVSSYRGQSSFWGLAIVERRGLTSLLPQRANPASSSKPRARHSLTGCRIFRGKSIPRISSNRYFSWIGRGLKFDRSSQPFRVMVILELEPPPSSLPLLEAHRAKVPDWQMRRRPFTSTEISLDSHH